MGTYRPLKDEGSSHLGKISTFLLLLTFTSISYASGISGEELVLGLLFIFWPLIITLITLVMIVLRYKNKQSILGPTIAFIASILLTLLLLYEDMNMYSSVNHESVEYHLTESTHNKASKRDQVYATLQLAPLTWR